MKARDIDPRGQVPMNFLFRGPPGTSSVVFWHCIQCPFTFRRDADTFIGTRKTTTARKMGQVYYDMGFLSSAEVSECSATDLVGQYVGHTGPKTIAQLEKALGKILFIDEASRLSEGHFASEAVNELVDQLTKPRFLNKIVVILAGYDKDINELISTNPGLSSRFPEEVVFPNLSPERCIELLRRKLGQKNVTITALDDSHSGVYRSMCDLFKQLAALPSFGNGREVETLAKTMVGFVYQQTAMDGELTLSQHDALHLTKNMLHERQDRSANMPNTSVEILPRATATTAGSRPPWAPNAPPAAVQDTKRNTSGKGKDSQPSSPRSQSPFDDDPPRDPGVPDEDWQQLQMDMQTSKQKEQQEAAKIRQGEEDIVKAKAVEVEKALALEMLAKQQAKDEAERQELERRREQARLAERRAHMERERLLAEMETIKAEQARRREQEVKAQKKLREMGVCVAGYRWIKQTSGYRCAGGSHWVGNGQLGL